MCFRTSRALSIFMMLCWIVRQTTTQPDELKLIGAFDVSISCTASSLANVHYFKTDNICYISQNTFKIYIRRSSCMSHRHVIVPLSRSRQPANENIRAIINSIYGAVKCLAFRYFLTEWKIFQIGSANLISQKFLLTFNWPIDLFI